MKNLIITLLATSSVDSLNPIGITQQFVLQGMVKKPRHIWYFIITTAIVNIIFGYLVYYGAINLISALIDSLFDRYTSVFYVLKILFGVGLLLIGGFWLIKKINMNKKIALNRESSEAVENDVKSKIKHVTPLALINVGIISTVSELTSAVPYFAFLSVLVTYHFSFGLLTLVLIFYNIIYIAPFVLMFLIYLLSKKKFDRIYVFFREKCSAILGYSIPVLLLIIAVVIMTTGIINIMSII